MNTTKEQTMFRFPIPALTTLMLSFFRGLAIGLLFFLLVNPAHANEDYKLTCTINKYRIGMGYTEEIMLSYVPNKMNIEYREGQNVQVHFPSTNRRLRGEVVRENDRKFSFRMSARSVAKEGMTYSVDYFKKSGKIYITTDFGAGYAPLGDASGTCEIAISSPKLKEQPVFGGVSSPETLCRLATTNDLKWEEREFYQKDVEQAKRLGLGPDCRAQLGLE